jgi:hypothetical protein
MAQYIYGASVQGIQDFIFKTNKLAQIAGASQIVDEICTTEFDSFCGTFGHKVSEENIVISAAGNLRYITDKTTCEKIVLSFPKHISNVAPGITISQAVVPLTDNFQKDMNSLERKLKAQRNYRAMPIDIGFMGLERARKTGGVAYANLSKDVFIDRATYKKISDPEKRDSGGNLQKRNSEELFQKFSEAKIKQGSIPYDLKEITSGSENSWIAVVHADGNGLGLLLQELSDELKGKGDKTRAAFTRFSKQLEAATKAAAQEAFKEVISLDLEKFPFRPVVLGGDDLTVIIKADLAYEFTKTYLKSFENKTREHLQFMETDFQTDIFKNGLTACAGIAYVKQTYPFHYAVHLAESLTSDTKTKLKNINNGNALSAFNFYKVQSSFIEDLSLMRKRTHFAKESRIDFDFGPYLVTESLSGIAHVKDIETKLDFLLNKSNKSTNPVAKIREWSAEVHKDSAKAKFMIMRIKQKNKEIYDQLELNRLPQLELSSLPDKLKDDEIYKSEINDLIVLTSF